MHVIYIDDSGDDKLTCLAAISVPIDRWHECLTHLVEIRKTLARLNGVYIRKEVHATDWLGGKGRLGKRIVRIPERVSLYNYLLAGVTMMPGAQLFNAALSRGQEERAFERLLNRINVNMTKSGSYAFLISDEGKKYDSMLRRMRHFNYIPSRIGAWADGSPAKNIPLNRIIEDINYRDSKHSLFIQSADCCAYALLRRENPIPSKTRLGLDRSFYILEPIMVTAANRKDQHGVIR